MPLLEALKTMMPQQNVILDSAQLQALNLKPEQVKSIAEHLSKEAKTDKAGK